MTGVHRRILPLFLGLAVTLPLTATTIAPMNLADLANRAQSVAHVTILSAEPGTVAVGGTDLPTITYRARVENGFKGDFLTKDGAQLLEITMLGDLKGEAQGSIQKLSSISGLPTLQVGEQYLLFTTQPSSVGLSTTVGLGAGCFHISGDGDKALVVNEFDNAGVFQGMAGMPSSGPVSYSALVSQLQSILGQ